MLTEDGSSILKIFRDNYHTEPPIIGFAWGPRSALREYECAGLLQTPFSRISRKNAPQRSMTSSGPGLRSACLGVLFKSRFCDSRLLKVSLVDRKRTGEISTIAVSIVELRFAAGRSRLWQGSQKSYPRKAVLLEHLARKVAVLLNTEKEL